MISLKDAVSMVSGERERKLLYMRSIVSETCPSILKALSLIDEKYTTPKTAKGYNLVKRDNRENGFIYYVRYWHEGKMIPSKWYTHTNDYEKACQFAVKNKETIITRYFGKNGHEVERFFEEFYNLDNPVFQSECKRNTKVSEERRKRFQSFIKRHFIPFLVEKGIQTFPEITVPFLNDSQGRLLRYDVNAQTVNEQLIVVKKVMSYGMRNGEIKSFSKDDKITISGCHFIDLKKSKTKNGIRLVPLHRKVYDKIMSYARSKDDNKPLFHATCCRHERNATNELGKTLGLSADYLKANNISFYSGRHAWKTMMNAGGLGEAVEEVFMGHRVTSDVAKLYNHQDKQGKEQIAQKTKEVFRILDKYLFE